MKKCSRSLIVWVFSALILLTASTTVAQDLPPLRAWDGGPALPDVESPCAPEVTAHRRGAATLEGVPAIWFHRSVATCLLNRIRVLPLYAQRVALLEQRLQLSDERDTLRQRQVALAAQEAAVAVEALEAAVRRAREAEESRDAWYRNPIFLLVTGAVVVVVLEIVAVWAFSELVE